MEYFKHVLQLFAFATSNSLRLRILAFCFYSLLSKMLVKHIGSHPIALMRGLVVMFLMLLYSKPCKGQDGTPSEFDPRIADGADAPKGRFLYMCSIRKRGNERHICGGTLIDKQWVMTAAHCLDPALPDSAGMSPVLYCGIYEREEQDTSKRFTPSRCYLHHLWDGKVSNGNDIALCQLRTSANTAFPALSKLGESFTTLDVFIALGWGRTSAAGSLADILQIGEGLRYVLPSTCNEEEDLDGSIKNSMMCAGSGSPDTCKGDSGGPLLIQHDPDSADIQEDPLLDLIVGITSFGLPNCDANAPGVYTRVSCYRLWIDCIMEGTGLGCSDHYPCGDVPPPCFGVRKSSRFDESDALERIIRAIKIDNSKIVMRILCDGLSPNAVYDRYNDSLLHQAAHDDAIESAKVLLEHGSQMGYRNVQGQAALSRAIRYGSLSVAQLLIDSGADVENGGTPTWRPMITAVRYTQVEAAKLLLQNGANIEGVDRLKMTPLHHTALLNTVDMAKMLIENGASIDSRDHTERTPLHIAAEFNFIEVAKELIGNGASIDPKTRFYKTPLHYAANYNFTEVATLLIENGANVDSKTNQGVTPLYFAARFNFIDVARLLLDNGANTESKQQDGFTPLHITAEKNSLGVVKLLLQNGANIESKTDRGSTPLYISALHNSVDIAKLLLDDGADTESKQQAGFAPLHIAARNNSFGVAKLLLQNGANIDSKTNRRATPLSIATYYNSTNVVKLLIENGANLEIKQQGGFTPLHVVAGKNSLGVAKILIQNGASLESKSDWGFTPLYLAARYDSFDVAKELIANGADIEAESGFGDRPLHVASTRGNLRIVRLLLDENALVDSVDYSGRSALYWAATRGRIQVIHVLLNEGASKALTSNAGETPYDIICDKRSATEPCSANTITTLKELLRP